MERKQAIYYQAGEFAARAGVTVRTLHYYDETGLLEPSMRSEAGYRLYSDGDLVRLGQISTLQLIGFPLKHIKEILDGKQLTLASALRLQREMIVQKRKQLDGVIAAIEIAERSLAGDPAAQLTALRAVMEQIHMQQNWDWVKEKYTPEQLEKLAERYDPAMQEQWSNQWSTLIARVQAAAGKGDPGSDEAQALAKEWRELIGAFTGGDPGIEESLAGVYKDERAQMPFDSATGEFIAKAIAIYKERNPG